MGRAGDCVIFVVVFVITVFIDRTYRNYLNSVVGIRPQHSIKRTTFTADVAVQTSTHTEDSGLLYGRRASQKSHSDSNLTATDLDSILKWSTDISSNINLFSGKPSLNASRCLL